jgi:hypothetical protein
MQLPAVIMAPVHLVAWPGRKLPIAGRVRESVREAANISELWTLVQELAPDLLLLDWSLARTEPRGCLIACARYGHRYGW